MYSQARPSAVAALVDRATRYAMVVALPDGYQADAVARMLIERMGQLPTHPRRSLTGDRGREMADHAVITAALSTPVFFCDPHHPWQRAENTIGCLRPAALRTSASGLRGFLRRAKYSARLAGLGFQSHVRRVGTPGQVALVTDHGILRTRPPEPTDDTVGKLIGEEVRWDGSTTQLLENVAAVDLLIVLLVDLTQLPCRPGASLLAGTSVLPPKCCRSAACTSIQRVVTRLTEGRGCLCAGRRPALTCT